MTTQERLPQHTSVTNAKGSMMPLSEIPKVNGIDLNVAEVEGPEGVSYVAFAGSHKEGDSGFFYQDIRARFFFYAFWKTQPAENWDVSFATKGPWTGDPFKTTFENEAIFRQNIECFFKTRYVLDPANAGDGSYSELPVNFFWGIAQ